MLEKDIQRAGRSGTTQLTLSGSTGSRPAQPGPVSPTSRALLADASRELHRALQTSQPAERFAAAHLAALRAAAAVLAARARPARGRRTSAWDLLARVAPELGEWAAFFAAGSPLRQAVQAGLPRAVPERLADDMVRQAAAFLELATVATEPSAGDRHGPSNARSSAATRSLGGPPPASRRLRPRMTPEEPATPSSAALGRSA